MVRTKISKLRKKWRQAKKNNDYELMDEIISDLSWMRRAQIGFKRYLKNMRVIGKGKYQFDNYEEYLGEESKSIQNYYERDYSLKILEGKGRI